MCSGLRTAVAAVIPVKPTTSSTTTSSTIRLLATPTDIVITLRSLMPDRIPLRTVMVYVSSRVVVFLVGGGEKKEERG